MSKSLGNCIYLSDDSVTVEKKVMSMFTDPTHRSTQNSAATSAVSTTNNMAERERIYFN